ncbi:MAG: AmmeMemoRadiSam system radical SAM enzyme [Thermoplasmata archaeon]
MFWHSLSGKSVQCELCLHECKILDGKIGICGVRKNIDGKLHTLIYGMCSSTHPDPIEKKPLYHFYPGTYVFSLGTIGCNFRCPFCQNSEISQEYENISQRKITPEEAIKDAKRYSCNGIAWTYNEPTIWFEYTYDSAILAKKNKLYTVYVTNGYINEEPLKKIAPYLDAMNIDIKAFSENFYQKLCKAKLKNVLSTCKLAKKLNIHVELTYLIVPTQNDNPDEIKNFCRWVADELGKETPCHFSRFHPDYKMTETYPTPMETLVTAYKIAKEEGLQNVYLGNIVDEKYESTYCPKCGNAVINRTGYDIETKYTVENRCEKCNEILPIVTNDLKKM